MPRLTRMLLIALLLLSAVFLPLAPGARSSAPALRQAAPLVIDFDDLTTTPWGTGGQTVVTDQYASLGVTFNNPKALDFSGGTFGDPSFVHSGSNAIQQCYSEEFCDTPLIVTFDEPQRRVKVWVGFRGDLDEALNVQLTVFDAASGGDEIARTSAALGPSDDPRLPVRTPLEVAVNDDEIRRVEVGFSPASDFASSLVFDDIEFEAGCPANASSPAVIIDQSANGTSTQVNTFTLRGMMVSGAALDDVSITASGRGGTRTKDITEHFLTPSDDAFALEIEDLLLPGTNTVTVTARTCAGTGATSAAVSYAPLAADETRVEVLGWEVTQTIQDLDNSVPLIAGKPTFLRVYLRTTGGTDIVNNVSGDILACLVPKGNPPGCLPGDSGFERIHSREAIAIDQRSDVTAKRQDQAMASGLTFELPTELTVEGDLHLALDSLRLSPDLPCDNCGALTPDGGPASLPFQEAAPLFIHHANVTYSIDGVSYSPLPMHRSRLESWLRRAFPTNEVLRVSELSDIPIVGMPTCDAVVNGLFETQATAENQLTGTTFDPGIRYFALASDDGALIEGCSVKDRNLAMGPAGSGDRYGWDHDGSYADFYGGHELAHTFGREHPGVCDNNARVDRESPAYPDGHLIEDGRVFVGFDTGDASIPDNVIAVRPYEAQLWMELMTYCPNRWISSYTYRAILAQLPVPEEVQDGVEILAAAAPGQGVLLVSGTINLDNDAVKPRPYSILPGNNVTPLPASSPYTIVLKDEFNVEIAAYPFEPREFTDLPANADRLAQVGEVVPWDPRTRFIEIQKLGNILDTRTVSGASPVVVLTSPNGGERLQGASSTVSWTVTDADTSDTLTSSLLYSTDDGATWDTVAVGIPDRQYEVDLSRVPGSDTALFRVIATDGVNTGQDDSDAVFSVTPKAPEVGIISPADGASFTTSHIIVLTGRAYDVEDGNLDGAALQWSSDRQGALGAGGSISARDLVPGRHTITLTATDRDGQSVAASIVIEIMDDDLPAVTWDPSSDTAQVLSGQFAYDQEAGVGAVYTGDGNGGMERLRAFDTFLNGWTAIVPGNFGGDDELTDLFLYSARPGLGEFYASDGEGGLRLLSGSERFTRGWDLVVPGNFGGDDGSTDLFFYDREEGIGKFYVTDGAGQIRLLGVPERFLKGWTAIVPGDFGGDDRTDLLFYDKAKGMARFYLADGEGGLDLLREYPAWTTGWDQIVPGNFGGDAWTDLFFYDAETKGIELATTNGEGGIARLGSPATLLSRWTTILGGDFGGNDAFTDLFFYDGANGRGKIYATDGSGDLEAISSVDTLAKGWDLLVPGQFVGS